MLSNEAAAKRLAWWTPISALGAIFTLAEAQRTVRAYLGIKVFPFYTQLVFERVQLNASQWVELMLQTHTTVESFSI